MSVRSKTEERSHHLAQPLPQINGHFALRRQLNVCSPSSVVASRVQRVIYSRYQIKCHNEYKTGCVRINPNSEARWRKHFCREKVINIAYSKCVLCTHSLIRNFTSQVSERTWPLSKNTYTTSCFRNVLCVQCGVCVFKTVTTNSFYLPATCLLLAHRNHKPSAAAWPHSNRWRHEHPV